MNVVQEKNMQWKFLATIWTTLLTQEPEVCFPHQAINQWPSWSVITIKS